MALLGWLCTVLFSLWLTVMALFWSYWGGVGGAFSRKDGWMLAALYCVVAFCWYKVYGWFPFNLVPKE